jgi:hypothetical protein
MQTPFNYPQDKAEDAFFNKFLTDMVTYYGEACYMKWFYDAVSKQLFIFSSPLTFPAPLKNL